MKFPESELSRRKFLGAASGLVAAGLTAMPAANLLAQTENKDSSKASASTELKPVIYRTLGRTGIKMPVIGMGVMNADVPEVLAASYEEGVRFFDTAALYQYGRNEQMVGNVIKKLGVRDKVTIATKVYGQRKKGDIPASETKAAIIKEAEESLKRLQMDYVDILYIHSVSDPAEMQNPAIAEAMNQLKEQKKIGFAGVTCHSGMTAVLNQAAKGGFCDVVLAVINFALSPETRLFDAIKNAASAGVGVIAMKTFYGSPESLSVDNAEWLKNYSGATIAAASLKWVLKNENITAAIPGYTNFEHMKQDFAVARNLEFTLEEAKFLDERGLKLGFDFCRQCRSCLAACPRDVDIPALMRTHMYAMQYRNPVHAKITFDGIPENRSLKNCRSCDSCSVQCAHDVNIERRIEDLKLIYA
ncbi:conserved exported hypothetical protein [Candidatus Zixiibacteriota bacterium]|nr:conserved exported hypothetical protein [candidate division Zixibacteria bacterium]